MDESRKSTIANILLLGSLAMFFVLLCRWFLIYKTEILEAEFWTMNLLPGTETVYSGRLGSDLYSVFLHLFLIISGNRMVGAILLQFILLVGALVLFYFGLRNYFEELPPAIAVFLCLLVANIQPLYFSLGPDELILFVFSLVLFLISLCTLADNIVLVIVTSMLIGIGTAMFPPMIFLWIPFLIGEKESERPYAVSVLVIIIGALAGFFLGLGISAALAGIDFAEVMDPLFWLPDPENPASLFRLRTLLMMAPAMLFSMIGGIVLLVTDYVDNAEERALLKEEKEKRKKEEKERKEKEKQAKKEGKTLQEPEEAGKDPVDRAIENIEKAEELEKEKEAERLEEAERTESADQLVETAKDMDLAGESEEEEDRVYTLKDLPAAGADDKKLENAFVLPSAKRPEKAKELPGFDIEVPADADFDHEIPEEDMHFDVE